VGFGLAGALGSKRVATRPQAWASFGYRLPENLELRDKPRLDADATLVRPWLSRLGGQPEYLARFCCASHSWHGWTPHAPNSSTDSFSEHISQRFTALSHTCQR